MNGHQLENSDQILYGVHDPSQCAGEYCTIHNMSDHHMREWPQRWRNDRLIIERICPHGVGHPDPDEVFFYTDSITGSIHGCDGCCNETS